MARLLHFSGTLLAIGLTGVSGCAQQALPVPIPAKVQPNGCRVTGKLVSTQWRILGGHIERAVVNAWKEPEKVRVNEFLGKHDSFEVSLKPGTYGLVFSAVGSRGATFESVRKEITIAEDQHQLDLGEIDLAISKNTSLYGKRAPPLDGIIGWHDTPPLSLKDLKGHVVVLDFFGYYCSICHEYKPQLVQLQEKYQRDGLVVIAVHDSSLKTVDELKARMEPILNKVFDENHITYRWRWMAPARTASSTLTGLRRCLPWFSLTRTAKSSDGITMPASPNWMSTSKVS